MNPQPDKSEKGFDLDGELPTVQERRLLDRVNQWSSAFDFSPAENEAIGKLKLTTSLRPKDAI